MFQEKVCVIDFMGQHLELSPKRVLFWRERQLLIVADVHFGKVGHFRKAGIAIPKSMEQEDLALLSDLIFSYKPSSVVFLGDLFHSEMNNDWHWLELWRDLFPAVEMTLVLGNHDVLSRKHYEKAKFKVVCELVLEPFIFTHEPLKSTDGCEALYNISGHIHPAVRLRGKGRQHLTLPCFYFAERAALLPAFGNFTGKYVVASTKRDKVYGIVHAKVIELI